jgi:hypothetical protein
MTVIPRRKTFFREYLRPWLWKSPYRYWLVGLIRQRKNILSANYDIIIDGYPRSANTFTTFAFKACQDRPVKISSHHHNPASVLGAIKQKKPALVLIREPNEAILSWSVFSGYPIKYNIETYIDYYSILAPKSAKFIIGRFDEVTVSLDNIVARLNARFACNFRLKTMLDTAARSQIFSEIERSHLIDNGKADPRRIARPSEARNKLKNLLREELMKEEYRSLMNEAKNIYNKFVVLAAENAEKQYVGGLL